MLLLQPSSTAMLMMMNIHCGSVRLHCALGTFGDVARVRLKKLQRYNLKTTGSSVFCCPM